MGAKQRVADLLKRAEQWTASASLRLRRERPALLAILLHSVFRDASEATRGVNAPMESLTIEGLHRIIDYYQSHGYVFVSPEDIRRGLATDGRYVLLTFDDGYFNNTRALEVLSAHAVPAAFFISTGHVEEGRSFWWDALHRARLAQGRSRDEIDAEAERLKSLPSEQIEARLRDQIGKDALRPVGDIDRPFTPAELRDFARHPEVHLGNHTRDHAILTNYDEAGVRRQIEAAQQDLRRMCGRTPTIISYPNGNATPRIAEIARDCGLDLGIVVSPRKNRLPIHPGTDEAMRLSRFILWCDERLLPGCELSRSDLLFYQALKRALGRGESY